MPRNRRSPHLGRFPLGPDRQCRRGWARSQAGPGHGAYAASKAGVHRLTEALAAEWKGRSPSTAVLPSTIDTGSQPRQHADRDFEKWVTPEELGQRDPVFSQAMRPGRHRRVGFRWRTGLG